MKVFDLIRKLSPLAAEMLSRLAARLHTACDANRGTVWSAKAVVFWGGGKDSTLALAFTKALAEYTGLTVRAVTMDNPGITPGTRRNIEQIASTLAVEHEYWHFRKPVPALGQEIQSWQRLYRALALALGGQPRFMCVACNFSSIVTEYSALALHQADFCVTGNPAWELATFEKWIESLRAEYAGVIAFPDRTGKQMLDYFRFWHAIYERLLEELFSESGSENCAADDAIAEYLYPMPESGDIVERASHLNVMGDGMIDCIAADHQELLAALGWRLPDDMQGGTESDCAFTASIAYLNIERNGLNRHLEHLDEADHYFRPPVEMTARAREWAVSGKSNVEGRKLLSLLGLSESYKPSSPTGSAIAQSLIDKLFKIR